MEIRPFDAECRTGVADRLHHRLQLIGIEAVGEPDPAHAGEVVEAERRHRAVLLHPVDPFGRRPVRPEKGRELEPRLLPAGGHRAPRGKGVRDFLVILVVPVFYKAFKIIVPALKVLGRARHSPEEGAAHGPDRRPDAGGNCRSNRGAG